MDWGSVTAATVTTFGSAAIALMQVQKGRNGGRSQVREDLEILKQLPPDSAVRDELRDHIDSTIRRVVNRDDQLRRNPSGVVLGLIILALGGYGAKIGWTHRGDAWGVPVLIIAAFFAVVGAFGAATDGTRQLRDVKGKTLADPNKVRSSTARRRTTAPPDEASL